MKYKAIIFDLDGTLIPNSRDGMPSEKVKQAIAQYKDSIHISVATVRPLEYALPVIQQLELSGPCILLGGAQIIDSQTHKTLQEYCISTREYEYIKKYFLDHEIRFIVNGLDTYDEASEKIYTILALGLDETVATELEALLSKDMKLSYHKSLSWTKGKYVLNISHPLATKQQAVLHISTFLGIDHSEIIGVGDSHSDFPLLMACGLKVAMGNAVDDLKAIADYVAPSIEDDGTVTVLEKFVDKGIS